MIYGVHTRTHTPALQRRGKQEKDRRTKYLKKWRQDGTTGGGVEVVMRKRGKMCMKEERGGGDELGWVCVTWDTVSLPAVLLQLYWKH